MPSTHTFRAFLALCFAIASFATGCLSSSSGDATGSRSLDAAVDGAISPITTGGNVGVDGGADDGGSAPGPDAATTAGRPHQGFGLVSGGVKASSSAHVLVTSTGQAPGGNATMHSAAHTIAGGVVGGTQQP